MDLSLPQPADRQKARAVIDAIFGVTDDWREVFGGHFTDELHWQIFYLMMVPPKPIHDFIVEKKMRIFPFSSLCEYLPRREELDYETLLARVRDATENGLLLEGEGLQQRCFLTTEFFYKKCTSWTTRSSNRFVDAIYDFYGQSPSYIEEIYERDSNREFMAFWDKYTHRWCNALGEILEGERFPLDDRLRLQKEQFTATRWHIVAWVFRRVAEMVDDQSEDYITIGEVVDRVTERLQEPSEKVVSAAHDLVHYGVLQRISRPGDAERFGIALEHQSILTRHFADTLETMQNTVGQIRNCEDSNTVVRFDGHSERFSPYLTDPTRQRL